MAFCNTKEKRSLSLANITTSTRSQYPYALFINNFSPKVSQYSLRTKEGFFSPSKINTSKQPNSHSNKKNILRLLTLPKTNQSIIKTLTNRFPITLTPYQLYEKLREKSFNQLKRRMEISQPFMTSNDNTTSSMTNKEAKKKTKSYETTHRNYYHRKITIEEINNISNMLAKQYNIKKEMLNQIQKPLLMKLPKHDIKNGTKVSKKMIKLWICPAHKIKLSYCKVYQDLNQSPLECFSI